MNFRYISGHWLIALVACGLQLTVAQAKTVTLDMDVELDQVAPEDAQMYRIGGHDLDRLTYDDTQIDPRTHRVRITSLSHYIGGHWHTTEPVDASILDLGSEPYRLNFVSAVNHGRELVALFEADTMRMAMLARPDFHVLIAGKYTINPTPLTAAQIEAPPPKANSPDTMPMMRPPAGPPDAARAAARPANQAGAKLSTSSTYGALLDNPSTKSVLLKLAPEVVNNPQSQMGRDIPFKDLAQFEPSLTADKLRQVDRALSEVQP